MRIAVMAVTLAMASVLVAAGLEKARHLAAFASTLRELGFERGARLAASAVIALEIAVAIAIIFQPRSMIAAGGVLALATLFAIAGVIAIRRGGRIGCGCFGPYAGGTLGKTQLFAFPLWVAGAALLRLNEDAPLESRLAAFAAVGLTLAALRVASALRAALQARGDRLSAKEMYVWLR